MLNVNWNEVQELDFPTAGGYAAKIIKVEDVPSKEYLMVYFDIADGKYKGYADETFAEKGYYPYRMPWSYKKKALWFFKQKKIAVEETNRGFVFDNNPQSLVGKFCGIVLADEEYRSNDGKVKKRLYIAEVISGKQFRDGDYIVPELKKLSADSTPAVVMPTAVTQPSDFAVLEDNDDLLPF